LEEIGSNFPHEIYNPYNIVSNPEEYYDHILKRQNDLVMKKQYTMKENKY
jgi:hypothetical protein